MISEIQSFLKKNSNQRVKNSIKKFIPTCKKYYGVKIPKLNNIVSKYKTGGFKLVQELWDNGSFEEQILASKILSKICKKDPIKTLNLIQKLARNINNWAVCDTLGTQGIKSITKTNQKEIFKLSKKLANSKNLWERRLAIVLLINFKKENTLKRDIKKIISKLRKDKEYYVKKSIIWIDKELAK